MSEPTTPPPRYRWPYFALAGVVLFIALGIFWVALAAKKIERQRDFSAPLPSSKPVR
jgi:hypothetical protein